MLTQTRLRELLDYDPLTGMFRYRTSLRRGWSGKVAGKAGGYRLIVIDGEKFRAARLAWLYMTGNWPDEDVDHIDRNRSNDAWNNLRSATRSQNMANTYRYSSNTSGYRGVTWDNFTGKWRAQVFRNYRNFYCGLHDTPEEAAQARDAKAAELHGEYVRLNVRRM
jgi:hypothetical protein